MSNQAQIREALKMAHQFAKLGLVFVPVPTMTADDHNKMVDEAQRRLDAMVAEWCRKQAEKYEANRPDRCDDCAHYDSGFNWRLMRQERKPSCNYGTPPEVCSKFYNTVWVDAMFE
jgi:hypothetical protein